MQKIYLQVDVRLLSTIHYDSLNYAREIIKGEECFQPIPLTEEILLKCGFEWREDTQQGKGLVLELGPRLKLAYYRGDVCCLSIFQDNDCIDLASASHKHLYQLQNLIFELTKQELKIEL